MVKTIFYIQYTQPTNYPPLEYSSQILANAGWRILFLGNPGKENFQFEKHPNIQEQRFYTRPSRWLGKIHYIFFCAWVTFKITCHSPQAIYLSDLWATPIGLWLSWFYKGLWIYHEHDSPYFPKTDRPAWFLKFRRLVGQRASLCILPNQERLKAFVQETQRKLETLCVWNCPRKKYSVLLHTR